MIRLRSIWLLAIFLFISFTSYAQHGSGGAGALGDFIISLIILGLVALLAFILLVINVLAYFGKVGSKSTTIGIFISIIFIGASFLFIIDDASMIGYTLLGITLSLLSILHLFSVSEKLKKN